MSLPPYDPEHEAKACVNELFYGDVIDKNPRWDRPFAWTKEAVTIIERYLREAQHRGKERVNRHRSTDQGRD